MNKNEFIKQLSKKTKIKQKDLKRIPNAIEEIMKDNIKSNNDVLNVFGIFKIEMRKIERKDKINLNGTTYDGGVFRYLAASLFNRHKKLK